MRVICFVLACIAVMAQTAQAGPAPKPVLFLWEFGGWGNPGPPYGLRFVLYDNGEAVYSEDPGLGARDRVPFLYGKHFDRTTTDAMVDTVLKGLADVPHGLHGENNATDQGSTIIQVWDAGKAKFERYDAYAHPCIGGSRKAEDTISPFGGSARKGVDPRFLEICDRLSYPVDMRDGWDPVAIWVTLVGDTSAPLLTFEWPNDWPDVPAPTAKEARLLCVPLSHRHSELTERLLGLNPDDGTRLWGAGTTAGAGHWWILNGWEYALPGEVRLADVDPRFPPLARAPCDSQ